MPAPLIRDLGLEWAASQSMVVSLSPLQLPSGRTLADFASFTLTIRADPVWSAADGGRPGGLDRIRADFADPLGDGWPAAVPPAAGSVVAGVVQFSFTSPGGAGRKRYALDAVGTLVAGGAVQLVQATWLTVLPRVTA